MALYGALAENIRRNERIDRGTVTFTGSTTVTVAAPIRQLTSVDAIQVSSTAPGASGSTLTIAMGPAANQFQIFSWQPTSSSVTTLIAATAACTVQWQAIGSLDLSNVAGGIP